MGQISSAPVELIRVQRGGEKWWRGAVAEMQGWRNEHEDSHFMKETASGTTRPASSPWALFGVLDGHGGAEAARAAAHGELPKLLRTATEAAKGEAEMNARVGQAFVECDAWLREQPAVQKDQSGSTCVVAGLRPRADGETYDAFVGNAGDSRGVLIRRVAGTPEPAEVVATEDHKPDRPDEYARIVAAEGFVSDCDPNRRAMPHQVARLDGSLAVSRGLGDFTYKRDARKQPHEQKVSCVPEMYQLSQPGRTAVRNGDILILACDGIFDVMSNEELAQTVCAALDSTDEDDDDEDDGDEAMACASPVGSSSENKDKNGAESASKKKKKKKKKATKRDLGDVAAAIVMSCLRDLNSKDNMTLMIIEIGEDGTGYCFDDVAGKKSKNIELPEMLDDLANGSDDDGSTTDDEEDESDDQDESEEDEMAASPRKAAAQQNPADEIVGLEKYERQTDEAVKRSYVSFLDYCARYSDRPLPREARALLRRAGHRPVHARPKQPPTPPTRLVADSPAGLAADQPDLDDLVAFVEGRNADEPPLSPNSAAKKSRKKKKKKKKKKADDDGLDDAA